VSDPAITEVEIGQTLLRIARETLAADLGGEPVPLPAAGWLQEEGACFVTLHRGGELRGCIGTMIARRPLATDVQANARAAAFEDPRFPPLEAQELEGLSIEVSLLSDLAPMEFESESDLIRQLRPGVDGLLLEVGFHRGTFLPTVWRALPDSRLFLRKLKTKAGLSEDFWSEDLTVRRYTTRSWSEVDSGH
jgi:AmmeMemoRadiSam system protein A